MSYLELRNASITVPALLDAASRHYWQQLVQQFYVLVLGLNILGNPYSYIGDFTKALKCFYEPFTVRIYLIQIHLIAIKYFVYKQNFLFFT